MTANAIIPFGFEDHLIRVYKPNGEPWFVGKDVCAVLEIKDHHQALERLDEDERGGCTVPTPKGDQTVITVSEPGVFRLIFASRKPAAERLKRFLAHEVLPALRKHGSYTMPDGKGVGTTDVLSEFPSGDEALGVHLAKLATLKECRMIHGPRAAARLWRRLGMPQVEQSVIVEADDARGCLAKLLCETVDGNGIKELALAHLIELALMHEADQIYLKQRGVAAVSERDREGFLVANYHPWLEVLYKGTPWSNGNWRAALMKLPGAIPSQKASFAHGQQRCVFIPVSLLDGFVAPSPVGNNVVPLKQ